MILFVTGRSTSLAGKFSSVSPLQFVILEAGVVSAAMVQIILTLKLTELILWRIRMKK